MCVDEGIKMKEKAKVLIMYSGYLPAKTYGGPVNSISNIVQALGGLFDFYVIASNHELKSIKRLSGIKYGWNKIGYANVKYLSDKELDVKNILCQIKEVSPDVIYLNSIFLYKFVIASLSYLKNHKIKLVIAPRGEVCANALKIKRVKKEMYLNLLKNVGLMDEIYWHSTSDEETKGLIENLNISPMKIQKCEVLPEKDVPEISYKVKEKSKLKCVFISRICEKKNLISAIKYVKRANIGVTLDIYGFKEDLKYWQMCSKAIGDSRRIKYCGELESKDVINTFNKYDLFLFPTMSENYGHVIEESLIAGCPVLISDKTPWMDIMDKNAGFIVRLGNDKEFIGVLNRLCKLDNVDYCMLRKNCRQYVAEKNEYYSVVEKYKRLLQY